MSTNKSESLEMHKWTRTDDFTLDEINENTDMIDQKFQDVMTSLSKKLEFIKLKEGSYVLTGTAQECIVDIDVSDINFLDYDFIFLRLKTGGSYLLRVNNSSNCKFYSVCSHSAEEDYIGSGSYGTSIQCFTILKNNDNRVQLKSIDYDNNCGYDTNVTYDEIESIKVIPYSISVDMEYLNYEIWGLQ